MRSNSCRLRLRHACLLRFANQTWSRGMVFNWDWFVPVVCWMEGRFWPVFVSEVELSRKAPHTAPHRFALSRLVARVYGSRAYLGSGAAGWGCLFRFGYGCLNRRVVVPFYSLLFACKCSLLLGRRLFELCLPDPSVCVRLWLMVAVHVSLRLRSARLFNFWSLSRQTLP